jgi:YidC/Oxa1 family membrane protein insertase
MDRNTIYGFVLIFAILIGWQIYNQPSEEEQKALKRKTDSIAKVKKDSDIKAIDFAVKEKARLKADSVKLATLPDTVKAKLDSVKYGMFAGAAQGAEKVITLENEKIKVDVSTKGGNIKRVELKGFKTYDQKPLVLLNDSTNSTTLRFFSNNTAFSTSDFYFDTQSKAINVAGADSGSVVLRLNSGDGKYIEYVYSLKGDSYLLGFNINVVGMDKVVDAKQNNLTFEWISTLTRKEREAKIEREKSGLYYKYADDDVENLSLSKDDKVSAEAKVKWVSFKNQFFSSTLISNTAFEKPLDLSVKTFDETELNKLKTNTAVVSLPYTHKPTESYGMKYFFGPNRYNILKQYGLEMEDQIPLGGFILFTWVNKYLVIPVFQFLDGFDLSYGIVILLLTLILKLILLPLTYRAYLSTAKMRILRPDIEAATAKIPKEDALARQQATMAIYKKAGVSPMGGCLPQLLQLPILLALFSFFPSAIELRQQSFLWANDLSTYDSIATLPFTIPFYGNHVSLFTLLMTASTLLFTWVNSKYQAQDQQFAQLKWMMYLMPIIFLGVLNSYPAGLSYYYFISTMMSIAIQEIMRRRVNEDALHAKIQENRKKPTVEKKSKFQQRIEDMAKQRGYQLPDPNKGGNKPKKK